MLLQGAAAGGLGVQQPAPQAQIPIRAVAPASATTKEIVGSISGLKQLPDGRVLINDYARKRLIVFDKALASFTVAADSTGNAPKVYPQWTARLLFPYLADTTLLADITAGVYLVIQPNGAVGRTMAPVRSVDVQALIQIAGGAPGIDPKGRLIFRAPYEPGKRPPPRPAGAPPLPLATLDSFYIARADLEARVVDTIGVVTWGVTARPSPPPNPNRNAVQTMYVNPVPVAQDDWAVLSDGSVAIVRAHDYHIDWVYPDGSRSSTPKMAFDWRRLTDEEKQAKVDSARKIVDSVEASGHHYSVTLRPRIGSDGRMALDSVYPPVEIVPLSYIADYVPPIRAGAVKPDLDGNLWILPTTSLQARGGLLYDVVNKKGEVFERVQLPADRDIAGFGRGGIIYLSKRDGTSAYILERTTIVSGPPIRQ
jgi:hypothetical protein